MDTLYLLEAQYNILARHVDLLTIKLRRGNLVLINQATKQFLSELSSYLNLQEAAVEAIAQDRDIVAIMRSEHKMIDEFLEEIYAIHVTEPDGKFSEVIMRVIDAVNEKLEKDRDFIENLRSKAQNLESVNMNLNFRVNKVA